MLSVIIPKTAEPTVVKLTEENLRKETVPFGSELLLTDSWGQGLAKCKTEFICFVEPDCLISSGYFQSMLGLFRKNKYYRQLGVMGSATGIDNWANKVYGFRIGENFSDGVIPEQEQKSTAPYPAPIVFIPGAILRVSTLKRIMKTNPKLFESYQADLVYFSTLLCLEIWRHNGRVGLNPNSTYVTTEDYVGEQGKFDPEAGDLISLFKAEQLNWSSKKQYFGL